MNRPFDPLPDDVRALLEEAAPPAPPAGLEARVWPKVQATVGALGAGAGTAAAVTPGAVTVSKGMLIAGALALLGAGAGGGMLLGRTVFAPPPIIERVEVRVPTGPAASPPLEEAAPAPAPPEHADVREQPRLEKRAPRMKEPEPVEVAKPAARDTQLSAERALLEIARTAFIKGDVTATLEALEKSEREFPQGRLVEEREVIFVQALVQAERTDEARRRAAAFRARFPDSLMLPAIDAALR